MKFLGRLKYYAIGLSMGAIMVYFMFGTRGCDWTPTNRIKKTFKACDLLISEQNLCKFNCYGLSNTEVFELINSGKVNFKDSKTQVEPKNYVLYNSEYKLGFDLDLMDSTIILTDFYNQTKTCSCDALPSKLVQLYKPESMLFAEMLEKGIELSEANRCALTCYGVSEVQLMTIFEDGKIDYNQSIPKRRPNPGYAIIKTFNGVEYLFAVEVGYKVRINKILPLSSVKICDC